MGAARDGEQQSGPPGEEGPGGGEEQPGGTSPWNIMIKHRQVQRRGRRSQMTTSFTDPVVSMDLLRAVLQPSINEEIRGVFNKYMKFFQKAALNVRDNVGEEVDPEQLIQETCRSCLEQAKLLFSDGKKVVSRLPHEQMGPKRKGRPPGQSLSNDRGVSGMSAWKLKVSEPVRRDGPKWDPSRLTETTTFVLGSRANKALGMGGTRGRLYIKHPHLFKYAADPQDKQWLAEQQHMRATGGKMVSTPGLVPAAAQELCGNPLRSDRGGGAERQAARHGRAVWQDRQRQGSGTSAKRCLLLPGLGQAQEPGTQGRGGRAALWAPQAPAEAQRVSRLAAGLPPAGRGHPRLGGH
ncbi:deoxynucleotidyltransferase terminal-interacting protein 1 isoform X2 [Phasianus colchicus]|uniref:deoxynucleotidyltransferase terminal-interacting protein 1 isoform X2 n=1 Tax=Phasianus colchicus TaxID=9054 RepID=UPI00129DFC9D|nr:deoxynucleotidyltransferase terminal-interacting protein 1 isoform X2 [Phasianus colchicus]